VATALEVLPTLGQLTTSHQATPTASSKRLTDHVTAGAVTVALPTPPGHDFLSEEKVQDPASPLQFIPALPELPLVERNAGQNAKTVQPK